MGDCPLRVASAVLVLAATTGCSSSRPTESAATDSGRPLDAGEPDGPYTIPPLWSGSAPVLVESNQEGVGLAIDSAHIYVEVSGGAVYACPLAGCPGDKASLVSSLIGASGGETLAAAGDVAVFFSGQGSALSATENASASAITTVYTSPPGSALEAVVTDGTNAYFTANIETDPDAGTFVPTLYACPVQGSCSSPVSLYADTDDEDSFGPIAVSGSEVFLATDGDTGTLLAVPTSGGPSRTVCSGELLEGAISLLATSTLVYFTTQSSPRSIFVCASAGTGSPTKYVDDFYPYRLATDGQNLYWTNYVPGVGTVATCPLGPSCASVSTVADDQDAPYAISANASSVFWTTSALLYRADR
jgi:hypothetical protein